MNSEATPSRTEETAGWRSYPAAPPASGSSAEIKRGIEETLVQLHRTLEAINDRVSFRPMIDRARHFLATPAGKALLVAGLTAAARRRPLLTTAACAAYLFSRRSRSRRVPAPEDEVALGI